MLCAASALIGGSGIIGLLFLLPRRRIESSLDKKEAEEKKLRQKIETVDELKDGFLQQERTLKQIQKENTLQCYCILACLRGLAEQGCNGPVHDGIDRMEKYLNKAAHDEAMNP